MICKYHNIDNTTCLEEWLGETKYELYMEDENE